MPAKLTSEQRLKLIKRVTEAGEKVAQVCREAGISRVLFYRWLRRYKKANYQLRALTPKAGGPAVKFVPRELSPQERLRMIERVAASEPVAMVCRDYGVSRVIFYRWKKRYDEAPDGQKLEALWDKRPRPTKYYHQAPEKVEKSVLSVVVQYPELSTHKIVEFLPQIGGKPVLGNHGVQNVLQRHNLTTYEERLAYSLARRHIPGIYDRFLHSFQAVLGSIVALPARRRLLTVRFSAGFLLGVFFGIIIFGAQGYLAMIHQAPVENKVGLVFASIALSAGSFFFLYSLKYYLTLAIVLGFSRHVGEPEENGRNGENGGNPWVKRFFGFGGNGHGKYVGGLQPNLDEVNLSRYPFVSIHLPMYNEKKVVNRLLTACTSFDYENYEVIVVDDSTDETTQILNEWKNHPRVKIIHRESREGFKGGALREALKITDPKTEFVLVFDADFIPYPDTITQFLKYFQSVVGNLTPGETKVAAIQGYQWHVLNKSENWITRGVRSEYAGSYVVERSGTEVYGGLKQIAGSVYMIRRDLLDQFGWQTSITEDFQLTLRLYEAGYKVVYTPYIQAPSECVSTIKRLVRQRMRWAEGHSHNIRRMFIRLLLGRWESFGEPHKGKVWVPSRLTLTEKLEFLYLSPYYLQALFFLLGTLSWFISEAVFKARLPFWTALWGWSLVLTNLFTLPLMNTVGLFLEESEERDYLGILSFVALSYLLVPFQAYASVKGFLEKEEGPWFRTPKTGRITDIFTPGKFYRWISGIIPGRQPAVVAVQRLATSELASSWKTKLTARRYSLDANLNPYLALATANNQFSNFKIRPRHLRWVGNLVFSLFIFLTSIMVAFSPLVPLVSTTQAQGPGRLVTVEDALSGKTQTREEKIEKIDTPRQIRFSNPGGEDLEMIFHQEPRVRIKIGQKELEITTLEIMGIGKANPKRSLIIGENKIVYEEIVPGIDLVYKVNRRGFQEEFIIKRKLPIRGVKQRVIFKEIKLVSPAPSVFGFYDEANKEIFKFGEALLFEKESPDKENRDVLMTLNRGVVGYELEKRIGNEGIFWMRDSQRTYPLVLDPTTILGSGFAAGEEEYGGNQRKLVFMSLRDRYYAVGNDAASVQLWRSNDNQGSAWTQLADLDDDDDDHNPTMVQDGDNFWVAFNDNSTDNPQFRRITTTASSETIEAVCTGPDMGAVAAADVNDFAVGSTLLYFGSDNDPDLYKIPKSEYVPTPANCTSADFTAITNTTDGPTIGSRFVFQVTTGDILQVVWNNAGIKHGIYSGTGWDTGAPYTVNSFASTSFSMVKDATNNLYVIAESAAGDANVYKCTATCAGTWSNLGIAIQDSSCASGYTDILYTSLTYDSTNDDLFAFVVATDATNERACFRRSTDMGVTWEATTWDLGWVSTDLAHISSTHTVADPSKAAATLRDAATYSFATVPEKTLLLLLLAPFLPGALKRLRKS